jgi:BspA type Leucine rich repeat region (6 copies)
MRHLVKYSLLAVLMFSFLFSAQAQLTFITNVNNAITITGYAGTDGTVVIPDSTNGYPVTEIGDQAFAFSSNLVDITISTNVTSIGIEAFRSCTNLTNVLIPDGVTNIGAGAFAWCSSLVNITLPSSLVYIDYAAFYFCTGLQGVYCEGNAPDAYVYPVGAYGPDVFYGDGNATIYYLPNTSDWELTYQDQPTALWLPQIQAATAIFNVQTNLISFNINWARGRTVVVEACTNVFSLNWQPVQTNTLTTGSAYFSDLQWTNYPSRFYRLCAP